MIPDTALVRNIKMALRISILLAGAAVMIAAASDVAHSAGSPTAQAIVQK